MTLKFIDKSKPIPFDVCGTTFYGRPLTFQERESIIFDIANLSESKISDKPFTQLLQILSRAIERIEGFDESPEEVLSRLDGMEQLQKVQQAVMEYCVPSVAETKNSDSSSVAPTPESVGSVENSAE